jgi:hypothetical protein
VPGVKGEREGRDIASDSCAAPRFIRLLIMVNKHERKIPYYIHVLILGLELLFHVNEPTISLISLE